MKFRIVTVTFAWCALAVLAAAVRSPGQGQSQPAIIEFDAPGANSVPGQGTEALANNDLGALVGVYWDANIVPHLMASCALLTVTLAPSTPPVQALGRG